MVTIMLDSEYAAVLHILEGQKLSKDPIMS